MTTQLTRASTPAGLDPLWDPEAVTVVGASADPSKWGYFLARGALRGAQRRAVHLVNRRGADVAGTATVRSLAEIDGPLGLVVLAVPAAMVPDVVDEALERGATGFVGITAGIDRAIGRSGAERELAARIRAAGARLIGPNCLGVVDVQTDLHLAWGEFHPGHIGVISQSGQLGSEIAELAAQRGDGVSRFVSVGNQVDVSAAEALAALADHDRTRVAILYAESFGDGAAVIAAVRRMRAAGKHTIVLTVGASGASRTAAASHTGSMTSSTDVVDAACRAAGALRVATPSQAVDLAVLLSQAPLPTGGRVAVVSDSGGQGAIAADVAEAAGLRVLPFGSDRRGVIASLLPADAGVANPIDLAGAGEQDIEVYARVVETCLQDADVDAVLLTGYFGSYAVDTPDQAARERDVVEMLATAVAAWGKPVVLHSMCAGSSSLDRARELGLPVFSSVECALGALAGAALIGRDEREVPPSELPQRTPRPATGYLGARALLRSVGVDFPEAVEVRVPDDVRAAARQLSAPWVLKADWIEHKTEHGAVVVGIEDAEAAVAELERMRARLGDGAYVLEEMDRSDHAVEVIAGVRTDPTFGPVVLVGAGGTEAELWRDTVLELAPVTVDTACTMVARLTSHRVLTGWRGRPSVDIDALARTIAAISQLGGWPGVSEIEVNPLRASPSGVVAVDALVIMDPEQA
ncbi:acetate--CoA ligase family protein [Nocardioides sambongensis]|uniref:acetate--CoA ligase family protein n=1 Tax=Nocardioides sambongensis TaxID=2589074 RepID=UPI001129856E|nr:acetate--CoA ligase [Nocardioides sambongensis]